MTRVYVNQALSVGSEFALPDDAFRHLVQALRLRAGDGFIAFNGQGGEYRASLLDVGKRTASARIDAHDEVDRESPLQLTLAQCVSKGDRMDYTIQKAVELGVSRIVPLVSSRSVVRLDGDRWERKTEHWQGVIASACEQSGRTRLPTLAAPQDLGRWLDAPRPAALELTLAPTAPASLRSLAAPTAAVSLLVGPEGGLSGAEIEHAQRSGFTAVRVGPRVLRTETAGVATLAAIQSLWGDW
ncbi:MAG TPA: 16S rRNA (uracil(1498)-N(3))-methyltransferase [Fontimonas sp.]